MCPGAQCLRWANCTWHAKFECQGLSEPSVVDNPIKQGTLLGFVIVAKTATIIAGTNTRQTSARYVTFPPLLKRAKLFNSIVAQFASLYPICEFCLAEGSLALDRQRLELRKYPVPWLQAEENAPGFHTTTLLDRLANCVIFL